MASTGAALVLLDFDKDSPKTNGTASPATNMPTTTPTSRRYVCDRRATLNVLVALILLLLRRGEQEFLGKW